MEQTAAVKAFCRQTRTSVCLSVALSLCLLFIVFIRPEVIRYTYATDAPSCLTSVIRHCCGRSASDGRSRARCVAIFTHDFFTSAYTVLQRLEYKLL